jgi:DNA gyrase subunit B
MNESAPARASLTMFEAIRKRPGMYVGDMETGEGLANLVLLVVDEFECLFREGRARRCAITIAADGVVECQFDGAIVVPDEDSVAAFLRQLTGLECRDKRVCGQREVPICAVTALAEWLRVEVRSNAGSVELVYEQGRLIETKHGTTHAAAATTFRFLPTPFLFSGYQLLPELPGRLRDRTAFLPGAEISFADLRVHAFSSPEGLRTLWRDRLSGREKFDNSRVFEADVVTDGYSLTCAIEFSDGFRDTLSFVNGERTLRHGIHVFEAEMALRRGLAHFVREYAPAPIRCNWHQVLDGRLIVAVTSSEARFAGALKECLTGPSRKQLLFDQLAPRFSRWLSETPAVGEQMLARAHESSESIRFLRSWTGCPGCPACTDKFVP